MVAVKNIPLSINNICYNILPFMCALIALCWLGERVSKFELFAMCCCFGGIVIVALNYEQEEESEEDNTEIDGYLLGILAALATAVLVAIVGVASRRVRDVHFIVLSFHTATIAIVAFSIYNIIL